MPVDDFQLSVLKAISSNRTPNSAIAGGSAFHQHAWRLSNDIDVFNEPDTDIPGTASRDMEALARNGYQVEVTKRFQGFCEAVISRPEEGTTILQWVQYSGANYYAPVADQEFGYRLSMVDLAVNKVIAAASRREPRDLIDLRLVAQVVPLWNALCAAPGKDASLTPRGALNMIRRNAQYTAAQIEAAAILPKGMDTVGFAMRVRRLLDRAAMRLDGIPAGAEGYLIVDGRGRPLALPPKAGQPWDKREVVEGPPWPSGPEVDNHVIGRLVRRFGVKGAKLWGTMEKPKEAQGRGLG